jgi:hypothetical protein
MKKLTTTKEATVTREHVVNSYLMPILSSILVITAGILLSNLMTQINYLYFILACCLFLVIGISIFLGEVYRSNLVGQTTLRDNNQEGVRSIDKLANNSAISNLEKIVDFEGHAKEIWILGYDLSWEIENPTLCEKVSTNLKKGVKYRYLLPDTPKLRNRAKILLQRVIGEETDPAKTNIEIKFQKTRIRLLQFGVCIYDPDIKNRPSETSAKCIVAFFPRYEVVTSESSQRILVLAGNQTTSIQEDFLWLWEEDSNPYN